MTPIADFAPRLLRWFDAHGRHDLPWQHPRTPYRVWLAEIMLQQTQVSTVIPYFHAFLQRFPTLHDLAEAEQDAVMAAWAGLGYYSRARNLHAAAKRCMAEHAGELPSDIESLKALPGIGRSTAGAILAQAHGQRHPILDGNVKRVLSRLQGIERYPGESAVEHALWESSAALLPQERLVDYTQALMDFGATLCSRSKPRCSECPFQQDCIAYRQGSVSRIPASKPKRDYPIRDCMMLLAFDPQGRVLLEKRPAQGVWAGLWSLPQGDDLTCILHDLHWPLELAQRAHALPGIQHKFTHFQLDLQAQRLDDVAPCAGLRDNAALRWMHRHELADIGLPAPIRKLLDSLTSETPP